MALKNISNKGKKRSKIVLLFPSPIEGSDYSLEIPLSILAVGAPLQANGYEMMLLDERLHEDIEKTLLDAADGALCVGVSAMTGYQLRRAIEFSRLLKDRLPEIFIVWGGYHPSLLPEQCAAESYVDAVVRGQGERTFQELVQRLEDGGSLAGLAGVTFRDENGAIIHNPDRPMESLDSFPPAPYELLDIERFFSLNGGRRALQYITSQGCPFKCTFCVEPKVFGKWSGRSAEQVVSEIVALNRNYHLRHVTFSDPNFFVDRNRVEKICRLIIESGLKITWSAAARADQVVKFSPELLELISRSGCYQIGIGIESGSQRILNLIDKRISPEKAIRSNQILEEAGIQGCYAFMVGFPKQLAEAKGEVWQTLMLIKKMRRAHPEVITITFYVTPYPGTPLYDIASDLDLKTPGSTEDWAEWESTSVSTTWISKKEKDLVERCNNFYFPFAYPNAQLRGRMRRFIWMPFLYPLHWMAKARCRLDFYRLPLGWMLMKRLGKIGRFRRAGSQIVILRGQ